MFEHLNTFPRILVVGPQRSGTRIGATMIAHDLNYWFVPEEQVGTDSLNRLWRLLQTSHRTVVQCPALTCYAHLLGSDDASLGIVLMRRGLDEIKASEERIQWRWEKPELMRASRLGGNAAELKYQAWDEFQKKDLDSQGIEVRFDSLFEHPLWKPTASRVNFEPRQTK